jgi:hypothetical protein
MYKPKKENPMSSDRLRVMTEYPSRSEVVLKTTPNFSADDVFYMLGKVYNQYDTDKYMVQLVKLPKGKLIVRIINGNNLIGKNELGYSVLGCGSRRGELVIGEYIPMRDARWTEKAVIADVTAALDPNLSFAPRTRRDALTADAPIVEAEKFCRAAWEAHPEVKFGWNVTDSQELGLLLLPAVEHIEEILRGHKHMQAVRLNHFRPIIGTLPANVARLVEEQNKQKALSHWVREKYVTYEDLVEMRKSIAEKEPDYTSDDIDEAIAIGMSAREEEYLETHGNKNRDLEEDYSEALRAHRRELSELHNKEVPGNTWDGKSIYPHYEK